MRTTFCLIFCVACVVSACARKLNCECGSTTPVEENQVSSQQSVTATATAEATETEAAEAGQTSEAEVSTEAQCPVTEVSEETAEAPASAVVSASTPTATTPDVISINASLVSVSDNVVTIQDDRFTQLVLSCTGSEYTGVTINIVLRRAYVAPSLVQAGCKDFYFLTADGKRSQTFHWP